MNHHKVQFLLFVALLVSVLGFHSLFAGEESPSDCSSNLQSTCESPESTEQVSEESPTPEDIGEPTQFPALTEIPVNSTPPAPTQQPEQTAPVIEATEAPESTPSVEVTNEAEVTPEATDVLDDPFRLSVAAECTALGVVFSVVNSGGAMYAPLDYSLDAQAGSVQLSAGEQITIDAGYGQPVLHVADLTTASELCAAPGTLSGRVWNDRDASGTWSDSETGLANVTVRITDHNGVSAEAVTDAEGKYNFAALTEGGYVVAVLPESLPVAFVPTFDIDGASDGQLTIEIAQGTDNVADFGYREQIPSVLGGYVWNDLNRNNLFDAGETGVSGIGVSLSNAIGEVASLVTDATGYFGFNGVFEGDYTASVNLASLPSHMVAGTLPSISFNVAMGEARDNLFFGLQNTAASSISGLIYEQPSGNTVFTILLLDANDELVASTQTDSSSRFVFNQLGAGTYTIRIDIDSLPTGLYLLVGNSDDVADASVRVTLDGTSTVNEIYFTLLASA